MEISKNSSAKSKDIRYSVPKINQERVQTRNQTILKLVYTALGKLGDRHNQCQILDLASGRGELLDTLSQAGYNVLGLDFDSICVTLSRQYAPCVKGDALFVDTIFSNDAFDLVVCSHFLEHTENPKLLVEKIKHVSKQYIILVVPNLAQFITLEYREPKYVNLGHLCGWDPSHFKTFLELHCDLRIVRWGFDQVILPPQPLWQRLSGVRPLVRWIETKLLPKILPYLSNSLIVLCEFNDGALNNN